MGLIELVGNSWLVEAWWEQLAGPWLVACLFTLRSDCSLCTHPLRVQFTETQACCGPNKSILYIELHHTYLVIFMYILSMCMSVQTLCAWCLLRAEQLKSQTVVILSFLQLLISRFLKTWPHTRAWAPGRSYFKNCERRRNMSNKNRT